ncbi:MerR family transcriptional regulator [Kribbella monticola]|uniref:MerR family transcriptional regulator n=1 Tax=Kribbella monticola TaxID=2185285 RepID=UPI000DD37005|nr:MerR family transcriptional regulator [Kribbella monticola]
MAWSIAEVARMSGVTSRTLRHYDAIGLLPPASIGGNGYRYYEQPQLLRLQQILVLRELGLGLPAIAEVLDQQTDEVEALRDHHRRLLAERDRLDTLVGTVARTIAELQHRKGSQMPKINRPENLFEGFDPGKHDSEAEQRWPDEWAQSQQFVSSLTPADNQRMQQELTDQLVRMAELMVAGKPVDDPAVQAEVDTHYQGVARFWTPDATAFKALGQSYVDEPQWHGVYEQIAAGLAAYQRDAMAVYADTKLS